MSPLSLYRNMNQPNWLLALKKKKGGISWKYAILTRIKLLELKEAEFRLTGVE